MMALFFSVRGTLPVVVTTCFTTLVLLQLIEKKKINERFLICKFQVALPLLSIF